MNSRRSDAALPRVRVLRQLAAAERRAAAVASSEVTRHKALAASASGRARALHAGAAAGHADTAAVHLMAAEMASEQAARLRRWVADPAADVPRPRLTGVVATVLGTPTVSITIRTGPWTAPRLSASSPVAQAACEAEAMTGQGPGTDAWTTGRYCVATSKEIVDRWPLYAQVTAGLPTRAVAAAPVGSPDGRLGALCAYDTAPGLTWAAVLKTGRAAAALTRLLLGSSSEGRALLAADADLALVHQAAGMISVQAGCTSREAHHLLAARAYAENMPLARAAAAVLSGDLRYEPAPGSAEAEKLT